MASFRLPMHRTSIVLSGLTALALFLSLANQIIIANAFGVSRAVDTLIAATSVPWLVLGVLNAMLSYSLVPTLVRARLSTEGESRNAVAGLLCSLIIALVAVVVIGISTIPLCLKILGLGGQSSALFERISIISWCAVGFGALGSALGAVENAGNKFVAKASTNLLPYAGMCLSGFSFSKLF